MDIKMMVGNKEVISPTFDFRADETAKILMLCIHGFNNKEQSNFLNLVNNITEENLFINANYIALETEEKIYFFSLKNHKDNKFEIWIITGHYDFMFAFVDENDKIIDIEYMAMKLNGHNFKELQ